MYAYGLRNPWRFSFDRTTGDMWIGDVGQDNWEEIDHLKAGAPAGTNFGWSYYEGNSVFKAQAINRSHLKFPAIVYPHATSSGPSNCAVMGGYVYRGTILTQLRGQYLYADNCSGRIWKRRATGGRPVLMHISFQVPNIDAFGEGTAGGLYVISTRRLDLQARARLAQRRSHARPPPAASRRACAPASASISAVSERSASRCGEISRTAAWAARDGRARAAAAPGSRAPGRRTGARSPSTRSTLCAHLPQVHGRGRAHRDVILLAGARRDRVGAGRVHEHLALADEAGGDVLGDHEARVEAAVGGQERRAGRSTGPGSASARCGAR